MKKNLTLWMTVLFIAIFGCINCSPPIAENGLIYDEHLLTTQQINLIYDYSKVFPNQAQVSVAFIENDQVSFYGVKRTDDTLYFSNNSGGVFEIGSITKIFTSTLLANFVVSGDIVLEDNINDYVQMTIKDNTLISFKELANHTSGLPRDPSNLFFGAILNPKDPYKTYSEKKLENYLKNRLSLPDDSGRQIKYSNFGVGLLGVVLCRINKTSYEKLLQDHIFSRYRMESSTTLLEQAEQNIVKGLDKYGRETPNWVWDSSALVAAGGILSNAEDLSNFVLAHFDESNKELELTREMTIADSTSLENLRGIGLGWIILDGDDEEIWYWHNGGTSGYKTSIVLDAKNKYGMIVLSNISAKNKHNNNIDQLGFELMKTLGKK